MFSIFSHTTWTLCNFMFSSHLEMYKTIRRRRKNSCSFRSYFDTVMWSLVGDKKFVARSRIFIHLWEFLKLKGYHSTQFRFVQSLIINDRC